jgi:hypothetical protein
MVINPDELIPADEAARELRVRPNTLQDWRTDKKGPAFVRLGKRVFYRRADLATFIGAQRHDPAAA